MRFNRGFPVRLWPAHWISSRAGPPRTFAVAAQAADGTSEAAATVNEEYLKRNYADNVSEYNTVLTSLIGKRRFYLLRDVYEDMMLDGVKPLRDTFHSLVIGSMKGRRLQDAFFFRDEMKIMGMQPDVAVYNYLISACGKCKNSHTVVHLFEEMKRSGVKPNGQTYICLLNAFASTGRTDRVYAIVRDMTAAGLGLNKYCYAGLITTHKNSISVKEQTYTKILDLVRESKGWSSVEASSDTAENVMVGVSEEELYNLPTAEFVHRRPFLDKRLTVYHVASHACADLKSVETLESVLDMLKQDGSNLDTFIFIQKMRCYLHCGDIDRGVSAFEECLSSRAPSAELYVELALGAMHGYTPQGMKVALDTLVKVPKGFFLNFKMANDLLLAASGEKEGDFSTANYVWDLIQKQSRKITPSFPAIEAYYKGLKQREIPADDPRLSFVTRIYDNARARLRLPNIY